MTELLEQAVKTARTLSPEMQDDIARMVLAYATHDEAVHQLTPEETASLARSRAQAAQCEFASDGEVRAVWAKHGMPGQS